MPTIIDKSWRPRGLSRASKMRRDFCAGLARRPWADVHRKLDLLPRANEGRLQAIDREAAEIDVADARELTVSGAGARFGLPGG